MFRESSDRQEYFFSSSLFADLTVINFGHEKCLPEHSFGPYIRDYYIIHFIMQGKGIFMRNEQSYNLSAGDYFIIKPDELSAVYQADKADPWEYVWIGFEGQKAQEIAEQQLGFVNDTLVGKVKDVKAILPEIERLLTVLADTQDNFNFLQVQGMLFQFLAQFTIEGADVAAVSLKQNYKKYVNLFISIVKQYYYDKDLTIEKIADIIGIHPAYLNSLVKRELHVSSLNYLTNYRMNRARFLLDSTSFAVTYVAEQVGYQNAFSFTRAYKRIFGCPPSKHRRE